MDARFRMLQFHFLAILIPLLDAFVCIRWAVRAALMTTSCRILPMLSILGRLIWTSSLDTRLFPVLSRHTGFCTVCPILLCYSLLSDHSHGIRCA